MMPQKRHEVILYSTYRRQQKS